MNERTKKLEAIFHTAMELASPEERERYLSQACDNDPELRREVDELLKTAEAADAVFQAGQAACRVPEAISANVLNEKPGATDGVWKRRFTATINLYELGLPIREGGANLESGIGLLVAEAVITKGWTAGAELCRNHFDSMGDQPVEWRTKATLFAYVGDHEWYRKAAAQAISLSQSVTNWEDQLAILRTATLAPFEFTPAEKKAVDALATKVANLLPAATSDQQLRGRRDIGALHFRLGRWDQGLKELETVLQKQQPPRHRVRPLLFRAFCLERLRLEREARATASRRYRRSVGSLGSSSNNWDHSKFINKLWPRNMVGSIHRVFAFLNQWRSLGIHQCI